MAKDSLHVEVVSKTELLWQGLANHVSIPAVDGRLGILSGRQPVLAVLGEGDVVISQSGNDPVTISIASGFASVDSDYVTIVSGGGEVTKA